MKKTLFNKVTLLSAEIFKLILKYLRLKKTSLMLFLNVVKKFLNYRNFRKSLSKIIQNIYKGVHKNVLNKLLKYPEYILNAV